MNTSVRWISILIAVSFLLTAAACATPATQPPAQPQEPAQTEPPQAEPVTVHVLAMEQAGPTVEEMNQIVEEFNQANPDVTILIDYVAYDALHDKIVTSMTSTPPAYDVFLVDDIWYAEFADKGYLLDVTDKLDAATKEGVFQAAWDITSVNQRVYGMPWLLDQKYFYYNEKLLKEAGFDAPPTTWEELTEQSLQLKEAGMANPFVYEFANTLPNVSEAFASMVFGRGGELIDEEHNPLWTDPESPAFQQMKWLVDARQTHDIMAIMDHETTIVPAMNTGQHAFTVMYNYNLAALNNAATSTLAGEFALALMPGETHECYGFAKFYNMTQMAVDRGQEVVDAVGKFIQYFAGEVDGSYPVAKRWAVEQGLGFGQTPLLDDPDVQAAFGKWVNIDLWREQLELARARRQAIWYGIWSETFHPLLGQALNGEMSVEELAQKSADEWNSLKERVTG